MRSDPVNTNGTAVDTTATDVRSSRRTLSVGVAGAGFMGRVHARSARSNGARLAGVSAANLGDAERAAAAYGFDRAYADSRELVTDPAVDVVHICTPNHLHEELAWLALAAGKHVVCEKPLAGGADEAAALTREAHDRGLVAAVPFVYRYHPMVHEARWRLQLGELGSVVLAHGHYLQSWLHDASETNWRVDAALGGPSRAFADIGCHWADLFEFVTGDRIVAVSAQTRIVQSHRPAPSRGHTFASAHDDVPRRPDVRVDTEDAAVVAFRTSSGAMGSMCVSQVAAGHDNDIRLEVLGEKGSVRFDHDDAEHLLLALDGTTQLVSRDARRLTSPDAVELSRLPAGHPQGYQDCFDAFVADVYDAIDSGLPRERMPSFQDGARMVALSRAVLASSASGAAWIALPDTVPTHLSSTQKRHR